MSDDSSQDSNISNDALYDMKNDECNEFEFVDVVTKELTVLCIELSISILPIEEYKNSWKKMYEVLILSKNRLARIHEQFQSSPVPRSAINFAVEACGTIIKQLDEVLTNFIEKSGRLNTLVASTHSANNEEIKKQLSNLSAKTHLFEFDILKAIVKILHDLASYDDTSNATEAIMGCISVISQVSSKITNDSVKLKDKLNEISEILKSGNYLRQKDKVQQLLQQSLVIIDDIEKKYFVKTPPISTKGTFNEKIEN